jgi:MFS family permease
VKFAPERWKDAVVPARLGSAFRWLLASSWLSNLGDGVALAAGPLLVASQTNSAFLVALAVLLQRLPWLIFGLWAGAIADRLDRRRIVMLADSMRAVVIAVLCTTIVTGAVNIVVILVVMLLLGTGEVFADTTTQTLMPMLVRHEDLGTGNHRLMGGYLTGNQLIGPPVGAFLFAVGMAWPFAVQMVCVLLAVVLIARISSTPAAIDAPGLALRTAAREHTHVRRDILEGLRWTWHHDAMRTLAFVVLIFNVTWAAAWSVLVLWSRDHLHLGDVGFGLLTTAAAVGGLIGTAFYGQIERHISLASIMRTCLLLEVLMHLALALTTRGWVAITIMVVFGAYAFIWGTVAQTVRQRAVPQQFQGRVSSVYWMCVYAGLVAGQAIGGLIAERWGLTAPFWFAFVGAGVTLIAVWKQLGYIAHADSRESQSVD